MLGKVKVARSNPNGAENRTKARKKVYCMHLGFPRPYLVYLLCFLRLRVTQFRLYHLHVDRWFIEDDIIVMPSNLKRAQHHQYLYSSNFLGDYLWGQRRKRGSDIFYRNKSLTNIVTTRTNWVIANLLKFCLFYPNSFIPVAGALDFSIQIKLTTQF